MFNFFKTRAPVTAPYADRPQFITQLFDKVRLRPTPEERLGGYIDLWGTIVNLEHEFGVRSIELEFERDEIRDAFHECTDPDSLYDCGIAYGPLMDKVDVVTGAYISLPDHLKARLLKKHILSKLDEIEIDPKELDPAYQHAFYEVESRGLNEIEMEKVLETEFGIKGWRSERVMNPHVFYD